MPVFMAGVHQRRRVVLAQPPASFVPFYIPVPLQPPSMLSVPLPAEPLEGRPHIMDPHRIEVWPPLNVPSFTWVGSAYVVRF